MSFNDIQGMPEINKYDGVSFADWTDRGGGISDEFRHFSVILSAELQAGSDKLFSAITAPLSKTLSSNTSLIHWSLRVAGFLLMPLC